MNKRSLDNIDLSILAILYKDARLNNKDIAQQVGLAPSTCLERIKKLQADKVIKGSQLHVDLQALGGNIEAMISVCLSDHDRHTIDNIQAQLIALPEVLSVYHVGGNIDLLVHLCVADTTHLRDFVFNQITAHAQVNHVETALVYNHLISQVLPSLES
jgi:DNA-binding Lrp family transcriptional regulator